MMTSEEKQKPQNASKNTLNTHFAVYYMDEVP